MVSILVVDDSKFSRSRVVAALTGFGYVLTEADSGATALEAVRAARPDLIVTDLLMPQLDGLGLIAALQREGFSIPIIVLSADIQSTSKSASAELGARAFLHKPFAPDELRRTIGELLSEVALCL